MSRTTKRAVAVVLPAGRVDALGRAERRRSAVAAVPPGIWIVGTALLAGLAGSASGQEQDRLQRSIQGPVTREAVTRSLVLVPADSADGDPVTEMSLMLGIAFEFDSADLTERARLDLDNVADALNGPELTGTRLTIEGHTDASGSVAYNLRLSQQRAEAVVAYLTRRGVAAGRLHAVGFGEHRLLPEHDETDDRQRRVEIVRAF